MSNTDLLDVFCRTLNSASLGYEIAYPGVDFDPVDAGVDNWLSVQFFPAQPIEDGLSFTDAALSQGQFVVQCNGRTNTGTVALHGIADDVMAVFPRGTLIQGSARVTRSPYDQPVITGDDRLIVPVVIDYSA